MLRGNRIYRGLPLRALAYVARNPGDDKLKVVTIIEPLDRAAQLVSAAAVLIDDTGQAVSRWTAPDTAARPLMGALAAGEGAYRLRVSATDVNGRAGSADYELRVELGRAGPVSISGLVLGVSRQAGFAPRMEFSTEPAAFAYLELYGNPGGAPMSAMFELASTLNGSALNTPGVIEATRSVDRFVVTGAVPIHTLPPGDYVVRAIVNVQGHASGRVLRTLRIAA